MELPFVSRKKYNELEYKLECLLCHATGGRYSKAGYSLADMCRMVDEYIDRCIQDITNTATWDNNLARLKTGEFGEPSSPEAVLKYWQAQLDAGYPNAQENVCYFEEIVRKEKNNGT